MIKKGVFYRYLVFCANVIVKIVGLIVGALLGMSSFLLVAGYNICLRIIDSIGHE